MTTPIETLLDEVLIAHELRRMLWEQFGERSVPRLSLANGVATLDVRGTGKAYLVTVTPNPDPWFKVEQP